MYIILIDSKDLAKLQELATENGIRFKGLVSLGQFEAQAEKALQLEKEKIMKIQSFIEQTTEVIDEIEAIKRNDTNRVR